MDITAYAIACAVNFENVYHATDRKWCLSTPDVVQLHLTRWPIGGCFLDPTNGRADLKEDKKYTVTFLMSKAATLHSQRMSMVIHI